MAVELTLKLDKEKIYCKDLKSSTPIKTDSEGFEVYSVNGFKTSFEFYKVDKSSFDSNTKAEYLTPSLKVATGGKLSSNNLCLTVTVNQLTNGDYDSKGYYSDNYYIKIPYEEPTKNIKVKMTNCHCDLLTNDNLVESSELLDTYKISKDVTSLTFIADDGYIFKYGKIGQVFDLESEKYKDIRCNNTKGSYNYTLDNIDNYLSSIKISASEDTNPKPDPEPETKIISVSMSGCYCDLLTDDNKVSEDTYTKYRIDKSITSLTFKPLEGFAFKKGLVGRGLLYTGSERGIYSTDDLTQVIVENIDDFKHFSITGTYSINTGTTFTNIYKVDSEILTKLSSARYTKITDQLGRNITEDLGKYIMALYKIYLPITNDYLYDQEQYISLGYFDTGIYAKLFKNETIKFNLGSITVNEAYNNVYDYKDTTALIYLPFTSDIIELDLSYVINQTLTFEYEVNFYNGNCNILISSTFTNDIIEVVSCDIADNIPYILANNLTVSSEKTNINKSFPEIRIDVVRQIPYNNNKDVFGKECDKVCLLSGIKGYVEVENILFSSKEATTTEKQEIKALLLEGVYINDEVVK